MAIMTGKIQMRQGQEVNFDPDKMSPGEWAVSLDTKYIRMCFSPGVCIRIATYEAFEADMAQIKAILAEAKTVQSAVIRINNEVSNKLDAVVEYTGQAKTYRDQAFQYRNDAERFRNETQQVAGGNFLTPESAVSFTEATSRSNITTTDTVKVILGKIKKFFTDLKPHAFSNTTNNLLATVAGTALDAVQGKKLNDIITNFLNLLPLMQAKDYGGKDFNTHPYNKILQVGYDSGCLNAPTEKFYGIAIKLKTYQQYCFQLAIRIDNGEVSNLFMRFNIGSTWSGWRTICINTEYRMRHYSHLAQLGLSVDSVENLSTILKAMPKDSILEFDVNATDIQPLFEKKIIPTAAAGYIQFHGIGRGRVTYTTDQSDLYVLGIHNRGADIGTYSKWKKYTGTEVT